jgi:hypothetical protein
MNDVSSDKLFERMNKVYYNLVLSDKLQWRYGMEELEICSRDDGYLHQWDNCREKDEKKFMKIPSLFKGAIRNSMEEVSLCMWVRVSNNEEIMFEVTSVFKFFINQPIDGAKL